MRNQVQVAVIVREAILPSPSAPPHGRLVLRGIRNHADGHVTLPGVLVDAACDWKAIQPAVKFEIDVRVLNRSIMIGCCFDRSVNPRALHNSNTTRTARAVVRSAVGFGCPASEAHRQVFFYESVQNNRFRHGSHMGCRIQIHQHAPLRGKPRQPRSPKRQVGLALDAVVTQWY